MIKSLILFFLFSLSNNVLFSQDIDKEQLILKLEKSKDTVRVILLNKLSKIYCASELDKAEDYASSALSLARELGYNKGIFYSYLYLAHIYRIRGDLKKDKAYLKKSIEISKSNGYRPLLAEAYNEMFRHAFHSGDNDKAEMYLKMAMEIAEETKQPNLLARSYSNKGILSGIRGNHSQAVAYFMKSMEKFEELGDERNVGSELGHIGYTFTLAGSYDQALKYLFKAHDVHKNLNDKYKRGWTLVNIGVTYNHMGRDTLALEYYKKSLKVAEEINDYRLILTNLDDIGGWYSLRKEYAKANEYLQKAYALSNEVGNNSRSVYISGNLAENYLYTGSLDKAQELGEKQLELAIQQGIIYEQKTAYYTLSQVYASKNNFQKAHQALMGYIKVNDSIFNKEKSRQIESLRTEYETEEKEQAIAALKKEKEAAIFRRNSYALLAGLILIVGFLFYYNQRLKTKKNRLLLEKGQEVEKIQSRFFTNITHEFRTPLTLILAPIATIAEHISDPKLNHQLKIMKKNAGRLLILVNQLLDLSKLESGKLKLNVTQGSLLTIIKGVTMSFQSLAESKQIDLKITAETEELMLYFDQDKIEKVLSNLLSNAFKFTPPGGRIQVIIQSPAIAENKNRTAYLQIMVKDTGTGIREDQVAHIFDRFYQADDSQLRDYEGSGIGLALTKEFVELHHGTIRVNSKKGQGTEMILRLPMGKAHFIAAGMNVEDQLEEQFSFEEDDVLNTINGNNGSETEGSPDQQKPIILLIEDNVDVRQYMKEILAENYTVVEAADGAAGVEAAEEYIPDLILSDVMMPKMDGYQVCKILKTAEKTSHIPIVLLTAKASIESKLEGLQTEADDYLTKPFIPRELLARVHNLIQSRKKLSERFGHKASLKPSEITTNTIDEVFLDRLMKIIEENMGNELFSVEKLGDKIGMSRSQLHRKLKALTGQGPNQLIRSFRLNRAHDLLNLNATTPTEIAYTVGFSSPSYFTKCFREQFGYTPSEIQGNSMA